MLEKLRFWTLQILFILLIIWVGTKVSFIFVPIGVFVSTLFFPILISGFLFFLLNPLMNFLIKKKIPKMLSIFFIYLAMLSLITLIFFAIGPALGKQIKVLINELPQMLSETKKWLLAISETKWGSWTMEQKFFDINEISDNFSNYITSFTNSFFEGVSGMLSFLASLTLIILTVPYILFYMLKDGKRLEEKILKFVPDKFRNEGWKIINDTTTTLASYIQGQMIVCLFVALGSMIGYFIIGLKFALLFGIVIGAFNIIPYVGPWIGAAPAVVVGFVDSPLKGFLAIAVIIIVQQIESNIVSPLVIGGKLEVHPLTIIILLLVAGNLAGVLGMMLAVPTYAVLKTIVRNCYRIWKLRT